MTRKSAASLQAAAWFARLSQTSLTTPELRGFSAWRRAPRNRAAYAAIESEWERTRGRFKVRPDALGFTVFDSRIDEPATFAKASIAGVDEQDAVDIARLLNRRSLASPRLERPASDGVR